MLLFGARPFDAFTVSLVILPLSYAFAVSLISRETRFRRVEEMVDTALTDIQKQIIRRHEYEGATLEKIAEELGMQPPAVRMQLSRARKTIREQYRKRYHEE